MPVYRRLGVVIAMTVVCAVTAIARADEVDDQVGRLRRGGTYKIRLGAALTLSRSTDPRAIVALALSLERDSEKTIRKVAALALGRMIDESTPATARLSAVEALKFAAKKDRDAKVRDAATKALASLPPPKSGPASPTTAPIGDAPPVFVNVDTSVDLTKRAATATAPLTRRVKGAVKQRGYAVEWPGGALPTKQELTANGSTGFIVGATVKTVDIRPLSSKTEIACTVAIRVAPWSGKDGLEQWEANRAASASGSAKAVTGSRDRDVDAGIRDCVEAVAEEITTRQVVPFIKRLSTP
jgi:hypothetical protein